MSDQRPPFPDFDPDASCDDQLRAFDAYLHPDSPSGLPALERQLKSHDAEKAFWREWTDAIMAGDPHDLPGLVARLCELGRNHDPSQDWTPPPITPDDFEKDFAQAVEFFRKVLAEVAGESLAEKIDHFYFRFYPSDFVPDGEESRKPVDRNNDMDSDEDDESDDSIEWWKLVLFWAAGSDFENDDAEDYGSAADEWISIGLSTLYETPFGVTSAAGRFEIMMNFIKDGYLVGLFRRAVEEIGTEAWLGSRGFRVLSIGESGDSYICGAITRAGFVICPGGVEEEVFTYAVNSAFGGSK